MFTDFVQVSSPSLPPPKLAPRDSLLPFLPDHHLPYLVPAIFYWVISFVFHFIDTRGFLSRYKLHTSAEDLTKNRASRKDVIKFALIQQAAQCVLGYLMADTEQFVSSEYAVAQWAQRLRTIELTFLQCVQLAASSVPWVTASEQKSPMVPRQDLFGLLVGNSTQSMPSGHKVVPFTPVELLVAKSIYWTVFPLCQYVAAMILADTFQSPVQTWRPGCGLLTVSHSHQTWGMKYNFSVYGAFWDWMMGTSWSPHDSNAQAKYRKGRAHAELAVTKAKAQAQSPQPSVGESSAVSIEA
ncbi:MAG: hypothetical protein Q9207_004684 [Kuettlingeria erythrocarpa]